MSCQSKIHGCVQINRHTVDWPGSTGSLGLAQIIQEKIWGKLLLLCFNGLRNSCVLVHVAGKCFYLANMYDVYYSPRTDITTNLNLFVWLYVN